MKIPLAAMTAAMILVSVAESSAFSDNAEKFRPYMVGLSRVRGCAEGQFIKFTFPTDAMMDNLWKRLDISKTDAGVATMIKEDIEAINREAAIPVIQMFAGVDLKEGPSPAVRDQNRLKVKNFCEAALFDLRKMAPEWFGPSLTLEYSLE
ncbi:hypothetical protein [Candidatus Phyllobacterium onerii]|uniref:hypothetical protein n=1 Tax=Candidatus Phyllobacterium onerii TaxID=3020828 RepID=UPI0023308C01|nr:hypothetical protein [Phyllobacterium sp. IY22]